MDVDGQFRMESWILVSIDLFSNDLKCLYTKRTFFYSSERFGFYHVNITDPSLPRTAKKSAEMYKNLMATRELQIEENKQVHH